MSYFHNFSYDNTYNKMKGKEFVLICFCFCSASGVPEGQYIFLFQSFRHIFLHFTS